MEKSAHTFDVVIVGGGLAGLSLAAALRDAPLRLALVEAQVPRRPAGWDARIYAISPANREFLARIGVWKHLDPERLCPIHAMQVQGDAAARLDFSAWDCGLDALGWIVESSQMTGELWENVRRQPNLTLFSPAVPAALVADRALDGELARLTLASGETLSARLLVAADGRDSWVRRRLGLRASERPYRQQGVVANFSCARPHQQIARQWFRQNDILAWLPLPGERFSMVWSTPDAHARHLLSLSPADLAAEVAAAGHHELGELALLTAPAAFPLRLIRVPKVVAPRLALIGDAAHGIHPLSGHGINLGFQDAAVLAGVLADCPAWDDIGRLAVLERYARARREEVLLLQTTTDLLQRLFASQVPGVAPLRNLGLRLTNALPVVKNALVRYAIAS